MFIRCLAQGVKQMYSAYGNSIIIQDQEDGLAKGSLNLLHVFPSNLKETSTILSFHIISFFTTKKE